MNLKTNAKLVCPPILWNFARRVKYMAKNAGRGVYNEKKFKEVLSILSDGKSKSVLQNVRLMILSKSDLEKARFAEKMAEKCDITSNECSVSIDKVTKKSIKFDSNQYYPKNIIKLTEHEGFLDAGMFDGNTVLQFIEKCKNKFEVIYAFEASKYNFDNRVESLKGAIDPRIELYNIGLWDEVKTVYFPKAIDAGAIDIGKHANNTEECILKPIQDILTPEKMDKISFIKMDIEGAEMKVLKTIKDLIIKNKPKLAISVYHHQQDVIEIPLYIHSLVPEYKLYLRHHSNWTWETVLYAVC